tara:strand:+ start:242 stop:1123 length:882 start_codon:yes stop_codon:yes gene_type:complete
MTTAMEKWGEMLRETEHLSVDNAQKTKPTPKKKHPCVRCGGTGNYKGVRVHQSRSDCFTCKGKGYFLSSQEDRQKAKVARQKKKSADISNNREAFIKAQPEIAEYIWAHTKDSDFFVSLWESVGKYGELTENQLRAVHNSIAREADYLDKKKEEAKPKAKVDLAGIRKPLTSAKETKLVKPVLRTIDEESEKVFIFSLAKPDSKNPNFVYVKEDGKYLGKISLDGEFFGWNTPKASVEALIRVSEDVSNATIKYGRKTGQCGCCGRGLTKEISILAGVGPVCADKYGISYEAS